MILDVGTLDSSPECWDMMSLGNRDLRVEDKFCFGSFADPSRTHTGNPHGVEKGCKVNGTVGLWVFPGLLHKFQEVS